MRSRYCIALVALTALLPFLVGSAKAGCDLSIGETNIESDGANNTCVGSGTLFSNTGYGNTAFGSAALQFNTVGILNTSVGWLSLLNNTTGNKNTAVGYTALISNLTGQENTATGNAALFGNTDGSYNTAIGTEALTGSNKGSFNTAVGYQSLFKNSNGASNLAIGSRSLLNNSDGKNNTALGVEAGKNNTKGSGNVFIGYQAGLNQLTGGNNISIGNTGTSADALTIRIGSSQTRTFIAGIRGMNVTGGQAVFVNANGQLGVSSSSRRYKEDIQTMGDASNSLLKLRPVTFRYKAAEEDGSKPLQYGLIAEEVAEVMPELTIYNDEGKPESVAYQFLPSLLLNEYQKQDKELAETKADLSAAKTELSATKTELSNTNAKLEAMEAEIASMKLMISKLAAASSGNTQLASTQQQSPVAVQE